MSYDTKGGAPPLPVYSPGTPLNQQPPPGSYGAYQPTPYYPTPVVTIAPPIVSVVLVRERSVWSRFVRTIFCALVTWFVFIPLVKVLVSPHWHHHHHWGYGWYSTSESSSLQAAEVDIPHGITLEHCLGADEWEDVSGTPDVDLGHLHFAASHAFSLPLDSDNLVLLSTGILSAGNVNVVTSPDQTHDAATIRVVFNYDEESVRDLARVCLISRKKGENGVGIFTPHRWEPGHRHRVFFQTTVVFPETEDSHTFVKKFETHVANTAHEIGNLGTKVLFDSLNLVGSNAFIKSTSLYAKQAKITTSNGRIEGSYNTSGSLILRTSNALVDVAVNMHAKDDKPVTTDIDTSNGMVDARFRLYSSSESGGSSFEVDAKTSNAPLEAVFPVSPVNSKLDFKGRTSNAVASLTLNPAYEGSFDLQTSLSSATLDVDRTVEDPSGENRKRAIKAQIIRGRKVTGSVQWGDDKDKKNLGSAVLRSSIGPVKLKL